MPTLRDTVRTFFNSFIDPLAAQLDGALAIAGQAPFVNSNVNPPPSGGASGSGSGPAPGQIFYPYPLIGGCATGYHVESVQVPTYPGSPITTPIVVYYCVRDGFHLGGGGSGGAV